MNIIDLKQLRSIQIEILDSVHAYCLQNGIKYSLGGGTLLGAVRHQGYIPWDDDIDIMMPRADYERFAKEYQSPDNYVLDLRKADNCVEICLKVCRKSTLMRDTVLGRALWGVNIDVFPIDGYPDNNSSHCDKILSLRKQAERICPTFKSVKKSLRIKWFIKYCIKRVLFFYPHSFQHLKQEIDLIGSKYSIEKESLGGSILGGYGFREVMSTEVFHSFSDISFEGKMYRTITDYDTYLRCLYGEYMTLPPVEKRISHHLYDSYQL